MMAVAGLGLAAMLMLGAVVWAAAPSRGKLAKLLDERVQSEDLFASAVEFERDAGRFGLLGTLTCEQANVRAGSVALRPQWSVGSARQWGLSAAVAAVLSVAYTGVSGYQAFRQSTPDGRAAADEPTGSPVRNSVPPAKERASEDPAVERPVVVEGSADIPEPAKPEKDTVEITSEKIDQYLSQMPEQQEVDLEGVTPIRWDEGEITGKDNPQNREENEKIDPVKLDADLLKDLQAAKKTKDESGDKKGGVDVAVIGGAKSGQKARGKKGGKQRSGSLSDAISRDPRGKPTRMAARPARKGLQVRSAARAPSKQKGKIRPMGLLEFLAAVKRTKAAPVGGPSHPLPKPINGAKEHLIHLECVPEDAARVAESYFDRLREVDR